MSSVGAWKQNPTTLFHGVNMRTELIVVDQFYEDPDDVRSFALQQSFDETGNYPGARTKFFVNHSVGIALQDILRSAAGNILDIRGGNFQIATAADRTWIHHDGPCGKWAGVLYLTPEAPYTAGTGLYRLKATGQHATNDLENHDYPSQDYTKWDLFDRIGNKYNRLILYRSDLFHGSLDYFGDNLENGRLFQVFFIDTEY